MKNNELIECLTTDDQARGISEIFRVSCFLAAKTVCKTDAQAAYLFKQLFGIFPSRDWNDISAKVSTPLWMSAMGVVSAIYTANNKAYALTQKGYGGNNNV